MKHEELVRDLQRIKWLCGVRIHNPTTRWGRYLKTRIEPKPRAWSDFCVLVDGWSAEELRAETHALRRRRGAE